MKIIGRIITAFLILCILSLAGFMIYFNFYGKELVRNILTKAFDQPVKFDRIIYKPPFVFHIINFELGDMVKANRVDVHPQIISLFGKQPSFDTVVLKEAEIRYEQNLAVTDVLNVTAIPAPEGVEREARWPNDKVGKSVGIRRFLLEGATLHYKDQTLEGIVFTLKNLEVDAQNIVFPGLDSDVYFRLSSVLKSDQRRLDDGRVKAEGWFNWDKRNMQATLNIQDKKQRDALNVVLRSHENDLKVVGEIKIKDFGIEIADDQGEYKPIQNLMSDMLSSVGINVGAKFQFSTHMDDFELTDVHFKGSIVAD